MNKPSSHVTEQQPEAVYVWWSAMDQGWRVRKWDMTPFVEGTKYVREGLAASETRLTVDEVKGHDGKPVAAPCALSGCQLAVSAIGDTVPRSRYDACNQDWLNAKAEVEKKQALLTRVGQLLEKHATTAEVIQALSDDALKSYGVLPETDCVIHGKLGSTDGECPRC